MYKRVVITGVTGAVGMALLEKYRSEGWEVLAVCRKGSGRNSRIPSDPKITVIETDLSRLDQVEPLDQKPYGVFYHLAWGGTFGADREDVLLQLKNIEGTLKAVTLAKRLGCSVFIGTGSQAEYGRTDAALRPDTPAFPESGYGMAKLCAGQMSRKACEQQGIRHVWVRILSVYGPFDGAGTMVSTALRRMLRGEDCAFTKAEQLWDFLYSADAADALYRIGQRPLHGRVYCLGSGQALPLKEYILKIKALTQSSSAVKFGEIPYSSGQVMHLCADISALTQDTGYIPATDFAAGIRQTIQWMQAGIPH